jgi:archaellum biogenesis ATPase FlaH
MRCGVCMVMIDDRGCEDIYDHPPAKFADWMWDGYIRSGTTAVLVGYPEVGKGILTEQFAAHVAAGIPMFGRAMKKGRVLYVSAEDDEEELRSRMADIGKQVGLTKEDLRLIELKSTLDMGVAPALLCGKMQPTELLLGIRDYCRRHADIVLVVLDTFSAFAPLGADMKSGSGQMTGYVATVGAFCQPAAVMFTHHPTKPERGNKLKRPTIHDVRDSSAIIGSVRSVMILGSDGLTLDKCNARRRTENPMTMELLPLHISSDVGCSNGIWRTKGASKVRCSGSIEETKTTTGSSTTSTPVPSREAENVDDDIWV